jgi:two-component system, NtrC family, sensor histidine kinase HydH
VAASLPIRSQDILWLVLFTVLAAASPTADVSEVALLAALAVVQVIEPRLTVRASKRGRISWIVVKLLLAWVLIGYTSGLPSRYWPVLLLPVISAATEFGLLATLVFAALAGASYLSFLAFIDWRQYELFPEDIYELTLRVVFFMMVGILVNRLAEALRIQSENYRLTAEQLAKANVQLQQAEEAVRRSDRLAALGQLSAGLAHELRNPLGTIRASAEMLTRTVSAENEVSREMAGFIATEVDRTNSLITRFLQFSRPMELRLDTADLSQTLDRAVALVERETPQVAIHKNYESDIPPFPFDPELLERVFYNLLLNAAQASAPGGAITIKTRISGGFVEVAVIDRGSGIEPKLRDAIFNPFFTTKREGVGLGLAIVSKIVDEHGGKITVESEPGAGSVFRVLLPMDRAAEAPAQIAGEPAA